MKRLTPTVLSLLFLTASAPGLADLQDVFPVLAEKESIADSTRVGIDPEALTLPYDADLTVYFIGEGAGYKNSFGWYDAATDPRLEENRNMVWRNASGTGEGLAGGGNLDLGASVDIGSFEADTTLGFFLVANGYNNPGNWMYTTQDDLNPDGISHVVAGLLPEEGLLAIGFEDLFGGGDRDFNDLVIAIDIGVQNATAIAAAAPEPEILAMLVLGLFGVYFKTRKQAQA